MSRSSTVYPSPPRNSSFPRKAAMVACAVACVTAFAPALKAYGSPQEGSASAPPPAAAPDVLPGGTAATVFNDAGEAFSRPVPALPAEKLRHFSFGNKLFNTVWAEAPASVTTLDGKGPVFNRPSCSSCHFKDGRGSPPTEEGAPMDSMLVRLSVPAKAGESPPVPHPVYGGQLNDRGISGVPAEGKASIFFHREPFRYPDGTKHELLRPYLGFDALAFGPLGPDAMTSARTAPAVFGLGLLEAVPEADLLSRADPEDLDKDGISGKANMVPDVAAGGALRPGRFGWKAGAPSLMHQAAAAALGDIGLTSPFFPEENCTEPQTSCRNAFAGKESETDLSALQLEKMEFYLRALAVPARRGADRPEVKQGERLFKQAGCAACHTPEMKTALETPLPELANVTFTPYTDLLLHDMGKGLADGRPDGLAGGSEWRTAPLWGLGLIQRVNGHERLLHDGRARGPEEAILWHGGEAEASKKAFTKMKKEERNALIQFLESL